MHALQLLAAVLSMAWYAGAHTSRRSWIPEKTLDLATYRLTTRSNYSSIDNASKPAFLTKGYDSYVDAAVSLAQGLYPGVEFRVAQDHYVDVSGVAHVHLKQTLHGLDISNADLNANVGADGKIISYGSSFYTGALPSINPLERGKFATPVAALKGVISTLKLPITFTTLVSKPIDGLQRFSFEGATGTFSKPVASLAYLVKTNDEIALVWSVETDIGDNWLSSYIDAIDSKAVYGVIDYVASATFEVYPWGVNDPDQGNRELLTDPWDITTSEFTWLSTGETDYTTTWGNNGVAQINPSGYPGYLLNYRPNSTTLDFEYPYQPTDPVPLKYANASVTQLFYTANHYHDLLYRLGFTEKAGNFETNNNGQGGLENDMVILNAQDGSGFNNANFATPPDGLPPRMRMYIWTQSIPFRDCAFDASVVIHEYTHGLSNRLTGGPLNSGCLSTTEAGGMGEGWSDFFAVASYVKSSDTRNDDAVVGAWIYNNEGGIRTYPYSTNLLTNPYTYATINVYDEVHDIGEIWATMLYEVLWNILDKHGHGDETLPVVVDGIPTDGRYLTMKIVMLGMALQPCSPTFITARNAILDADKILTGGDNQCEIWTGFAKRGLGAAAAYLPYTHHPCSSS
ncbi:extracellular metallo proteinase 9 [Aspergillus pseudoustus]|uniref:Extracellular metalloproteinase n=1 Tax=Aspergillus pseudoustus TaxID=1810923 RepID=A0ABR4J668_9EURO